MHRGLSTKAGANVLQPAEEAPLIEWGVRQNVSLLTVMHRSSGSAEQWGSSKSQSGACRRLARPEGPCLLLSGPTTARPARCSCGEAASLSSEYSTACSKVIARPSARAASKASSPIWERTAATVLSYGER